MAIAGVIGASAAVVLPRYVMDPPAVRPWISVKLRFDMARISLRKQLDMMSDRMGKSLDERVADMNRLSATIGEFKPCHEGMVFIPGGNFTMGDTESDKGNVTPAHQVIVSAFCIDITEVTTEAYISCVNSGKCGHALQGQLCNTSPSRISNRKQHPVNCVTNRNAEQYCGHMGKQLPTEEEWEYAARGVESREYPWSGNRATIHELPGNQLCWGASETCHVDTFPDGRTPQGVADMAGNVWEIAHHCNNVKAGQAACVGAWYELRGGSWRTSKASILVPRGATRARPEQLNDDRDDVGFRCVRATDDRGATCNAMAKVVDDAGARMGKISSSNPQSALELVSEFVHTLDALLAKAEPKFQELQAVSSEYQKAAKSINGASQNFFTWVQRGRAAVDLAMKSIGENAATSNKLTKACASTLEDATACAQLSPLLDRLSDPHNSTELSGVLPKIDELTFTSDRVRLEIRDSVATLHAAENALQDAKQGESEVTKAAESLNTALKDFASAIDEHKKFCSVP